MNRHLSAFCIEEVKNCVVNFPAIAKVGVADIPSDLAFLYTAVVVIGALSHPLKVVRAVRWLSKLPIVAWVHLKNQSFVLAHHEFLIVRAHVAEHLLVYIDDLVTGPRGTSCADKLLVYIDLLGSGQHGKRCDC